MSKVSVVIPTMLRSELIEAVSSVRNQTIGRTNVEIVVVADRPRTDLESALEAQLVSVDQLLFTGGGAGAPTARNLGVRRSKGDWVAFLDDDDYWAPTKLEEQLKIAESIDSSQGVIISSRVRQSKGGADSLTAPVPTRCFRDGDIVESYLFKGRTPSLGRSSLFTSTLLVDRKLALNNPWDESLSRHQDWDWLIRAQKSGASLHQLSAVLSTQRVGSDGSISASTDWQSSLDWARSWKDAWTPQTYVDFITGQPLRYALQGRSLTGLRQCLAEILGHRRIPSVGPVLIGAAGLLSRSQLERLLVGVPLGRKY